MLLQSDFETLAISDPVKYPFPIPWISDATKNQSPPLSGLFAFRPSRSQRKGACGVLGGHAPDLVSLPAARPFPTKRGH